MFARIFISIYNVGFKMAASANKDELAKYCIFIHSVHIILILWCEFSLNYSLNYSTVNIIYSLHKILWLKWYRHGLTID